MEWQTLKTLVRLLPNDRNLVKAGRGSSFGSASARYADGRGFDPHVRQHSFVEIGHEIISTSILSLPLIQEGSCQLLAKECTLTTG